MNDDERIVELLERAVSDVRPASRRPTDDVLARAARHPLAGINRRLRAFLGAVVALGAVGGGAYALGTANSPEEPTPPVPVSLDATLPAGWVYDDSGISIRCGTTLQPKTVYRGVNIADITQCPADARLEVTGPVLAVGTVSAARESLAVLGKPTVVDGRVAWAWNNGDSPVDIGVFKVIGSDAGYVVAAPHGEGSPIGPSMLDGGNWTVAQEALALTAQVTSSGDAQAPFALPASVSAIRLTPGQTGEGDEAGAWIRSPDAVAQVLATLAPVTPETPKCEFAKNARSLWLQDAGSGRWARIIVAESLADCRTAWSELGGQARLTGDPVSTAQAHDEGDLVARLPAAPEDVTAAGLSVALPTGWTVFRDEVFDPCTATAPTVVLASLIEPSCSIGPGMRPYQPFLLLSSRALEEGRFTTDSGIVLAGDPTPRPGRDGSSVSWSDEDLTIEGVPISGRLGIPEKGEGRFLLAGLSDPQAQAAIERLVGMAP